MKIPYLPEFCNSLYIFSNIDLEALLPQEDDEIFANLALPTEEDPSTSERFREPFSTEEIDSIAKKSTPKATKNKQLWAKRAFDAWKESRDQRGSPPFTGDLLSKSDEDLETVLMSFVAEARKQDGKEYPGKTLYELITALQGYFRENGRFVSFLDQTSSKFVKLRRVLDSCMKARAAAGIGTTVQQARIIEAEEEDNLWRAGTFSYENPKGLFNATFYYLGLRCCLRGGEEMYGLMKRNFKFEQRDGLNVLIYTEDRSKNKSGGLKDRKRTRKVVEVVECKEAGEKCLVKLMKTYLGLVPHGVEHLLCKPVTDKTPKGRWFSLQRVGINSCRAMIKGLFGSMGSGRKTTNHSMRRTSLTRLFNASK